MPVVRISDKNWERLKRWARPLEDTVDDVLSRVLDIAESKSTLPVSEAPRQKGDALENSQPACPPVNPNPLLAEFEEWLANQPRIRFQHAKETMNTYVLEISTVKGRRQPKLFVPTKGGNRLYLPIGDYSPADPERRVIYKNAISKQGSLIGWNIYPQLEVKNSADLELAKKLVQFALENFGTRSNAEF